MNNAEIAQVHTLIADLRKIQKVMDEAKAASDAEYARRTAANSAALFRHALDAQAAGASVRTIANMLGFASNHKTERFLAGLPVRGTGPSYKRAQNNTGEDVDDWELPF